MINTPIRKVCILGGLLMFLFCRVAEGKEIEILSKKWFSAPPLSMKCIKASERIISEQAAKKFVDVVLFIKNRTNKSHKLSSAQTYSFYLQDTQGKIYSSELFGRKVALYWYSKSQSTLDKDLSPREMVKATITFLISRDSIPGKLIIRSLDYENAIKEVEFAEVVGEKELYIPKHTLTPLSEIRTKESQEKKLGFALGGKLSLFYAKTGSINFMLGASISRPIGDKYLAKVSVDSASYNDPAGKVTLVPLSLILNRDFLSRESLKFYAGLGGAYLTHQSDNLLLSDNTFGAILAVGVKKELKHDLSGNIEIQHFLGEGTSLGLEITKNL